MEKPSRAPGEESRTRQVGTFGRAQGWRCAGGDAINTEAVRIAKKALRRVGRSELRTTFGCSAWGFRPVRFENFSHVGDAYLPEVRLWIFERGGLWINRSKICVIKQRLGITFLLFVWDGYMHQHHLADPSSWIQQNGRVGYVRYLQGQAATIVRVYPRRSLNQCERSGYGGFCEDFSRHIEGKLDKFQSLAENCMVRRNYQEVTAPAKTLQEAAGVT